MTMTKLYSVAVTALLVLATAGLAVAQTGPTGAQPATGAASDPVLEAKWNALDKDGKGVLEGAALESMKTVLPQIDTNKDGKVSKAEYMAAAKAGLIK
jgi:hypothetical protein